MLLIIVVAVVFAALAVVLLAFAIFNPMRRYPNLTDAELRGVEDAAKRIELQNERARLRNDTRNSMLQPFTILTIFATILFTWQQLLSQNEQRREQTQQFKEQISLSRDGQTADRYTHAIDQLTSHRAEVRAGGLYALSEISNQGPTHKPGTASGLRITIDQVVAGYLRSRFPLKHTKTCYVLPIKPTVDTTGVPQSLFNPLEEGTFPRAPVDLDAAMWALGQRIPGILAVVDLKRVDLVGATASDGQLYGAELDGSWLNFINFRDANLFRAHLVNIVACNSDFREADLRQSQMDGADLNGSSMFKANLSGADLTNASLANSDLTGANLTGAYMNNADLSEANLGGADLSKAYLGGAKLNGAIADNKTKWPPGFDWRKQGVKYCSDLTDIPIC